MSADTHKFTVFNSDEVYTIKNLDGTGYSETIKASNHSNVGIVCSGLIKCGFEDCVDIVRGYKYNLSGGTYLIEDNTRTFITIKGGVKDIHIHDIRLIGKPSFFWDISLGDHTIYNDSAPHLPPVREIYINNVKRYSDLTFKERLPVRILVFHSKVPVIKDFDKRYYKLIIIPKFIVKTWFLIKRILSKWGKS